MFMGKIQEQIQKIVKAKPVYEAQLTDETINEMHELKMEIEKALREKKLAEKYFHHVVGDDAVEWAILRQMAAEQEYRMLLNKARTMKVDWSRVRGGSA